VRVLLCTTLLTLLPRFALAQQATAAARVPDTVDYVYSAIVGTGWYKVGDREIFVLRIPASWTIRQAESNRRPGIKLLLPVTFGLQDFSFDDILETTLDNVGTITFLPGVEVTFPVRPNWSVKPYGQIGYGWDITNGEGANVFATGIRSLTRFRERKFLWDIGADLTFAGQNPQNAPSDSLGLIKLGLQFSIPMRWVAGGRRTFMQTHLIYTSYFDSLKFKNVIVDDDLVQEEYEIAVSIGIDPGINILGYNADQIGIGYRFGDVKAITLVTSFPF